MAVETYIQLFESRTQGSRKIWEEACAVLPGGVAGSGGYLSPHPIYVDKAKGGRFTDVDGNEYIDLLLCGSANILGHSPDVVIEAVKKQLGGGTALILFNPIGVELAKKIRQINPFVE